MSQNLARFVSTVSRTFPNTEYLRAIEMNTNTWRFHAHLIICFSAEVPKSFTLDWVKKNWKCGRCSVAPIDDYQGLFIYVTLQHKNKKDGKVPKDEDLTRFPKGARIISKSRNFGKAAEPTEELITKAEALKLISESQKQGSGCRIHVDKHFFRDPATETLHECWDRVFIRADKNKNKESKNEQSRNS